MVELVEWVAILDVFSANWRYQLLVEHSLLRMLTYGY